ncbi:Uncharacterized protein Fot_04915 [Forsythia ovata]|uniref:Uncharacterized protein n=1 Tax=Forsythia ovata TaxID=205694 RepID=A0ABD1WNM4_9LAMI
MKTFSETVCESERIWKETQIWRLTANSSAPLSILSNPRFELDKINTVPPWLEAQIRKSQRASRANKGQRSKKEKGQRAEPKIKGSGRSQNCVASEAQKWQRPEFDGFNRLVYMPE